MIAIFESTFSPLFAYIKRRVGDEGVAAKLIVEVYQRFFDIPFLEEGKESLTLYNLAFNVLKEKHAIVFGGGLWTDLGLIEGEILRLRYFENLNSVEIAFVIGESVGKVDALLYATLVKAQRLLKHGDINEYLKTEKKRQEAIVSDRLKYEIGEELFDKEYNIGRDFVLPVQGYEKPKVKDFFTKPMTDTEKKEFGVPAAEANLPVEEYWVPEDKESALPKENPLGYGMDLLKTFMRNDTKDEHEFAQPSYDLPVEETGAPEGEATYQLPKLWKLKAWLSPLIALTIILGFIWFYPFKDEVKKFTESYNVSYTDNISFDERRDLIKDVLTDLVASRNVADIKIEKLTEKNFQVLLGLKESDKKEELFVFYRLDDGRWAARKYQAIMAES